MVQLDDVEEPVPAEPYVPEGHPAHDKAPELDWNLPEGHVVQLVAAKYCPAGQAAMLEAEIRRQMQIFPEECVQSVELDAAVLYITVLVLNAR